MEDNLDTKIFLGQSIDEGKDFIPIINEDTDIDAEISDVLPILPLRNTVLFPGVVIPIAVGREKSLALVREAYKGDRMIGVVAQLDGREDNPTPEQLHDYGTLAHIIKMLEMPDGSTSVIIQGKKRFKITEVYAEDPYITALVEAREDIVPEITNKFQAILDSVKDMAIKAVQLSENMPQEAGFAIKNIETPQFLINFVSSNIDFKIEEKQELLEEDDLTGRASRLMAVMAVKIQELQLKDDIQSKVRTELDKQQKEYFLNQQIKTIQNELGEDPVDMDVKDLKQKAKDKKWSEEVEKRFYKEVGKLERMNPAAPDYANHLNFLELMVELPWNEYTEDNFDLMHAQNVLDDEHFGLEKVKDRILEHLAVLKLKGDLKAPIICLHGPPGVGKTSLGRSVANALGRKYARIALGGLHDEAEIRGHRKTYIGALPGRIIQNIKKTNCSNPVFILDEIDKVGSDFRGDPSFALLEVLDPEQNASFYDNYLEMEYDLSKVLFIATANSIETIKPALRDRMEIIHVSGYIQEEKVEIARRHLIPKQLKAHGVKSTQLKFPKAVVEDIVENYTRESGVRGLDKQIAAVVRQVAKKIAFEQEYNISLTIDDVREYLGAKKFSRDKYQGNEFAGVVTGLAWTAVGGEILFIETALSKGTGRLTLTGNLGDVMKESAVIALEYIKSKAGELGIKDTVLEKNNFHIHVPEGAIPKDGPSAGITMATALVSAITRRKVKKGIAMTGEITLRGKVLPVGGIKEKILAAKRADIKEIILSKENQKDVEEIKEIYIKGLKFHFVDTIRDVLDVALLKQKVALQK